MLNGTFFYYKTSCGLVKAKLTSSYIIGKWGYSAEVVEENVTGATDEGFKVGASFHASISEVAKGITVAAKTAALAKCQEDDDWPSADELAEEYAHFCDFNDLNMVLTPIEQYQHLLNSLDLVSMQWLVQHIEMQAHC